MCEVLKVSRSGYSSWLSRPESERSKANRRLLSDIRVVHDRSRKTYGSPRVTAELHAQRVGCGENRVARLMRENGIRAKRRLNQALGRREVQPGLLHHSDRGRQYASDDYQDLLKDNKIICSMSRKADPWDNAPMESFFGSLKTELIYDERFLTREDAKAKIFEYIEVFYNRERRHSSLGFKSPVDFERTATLT
jgi:transposase InsO family protein